MEGSIFDIKKFALHDGPGIRTTIFLKGCPLRCVWCQNPEGLYRNKQLWYFKNRCIQCNECIQFCPSQALTASSSDGDYIKIDYTKCNNCGICVDRCPAEALCFDSNEISVDAAVETLLEDRIFYEKSGGGITISGGEPFFQHEFSKALLRACKHQGVHTAIETSLQVENSILQQFVDIVDLFIVDIKLIDSVQHKTYTGLGNSTILSNFAYLIGKGVTPLVRIPLIPTITATKENLEGIAKYVHKLSPNGEIELINFNPLAINKYRLMGIEQCELLNMKPYNTQELEEFTHHIENVGISVI